MNPDASHPTKRQRRRPLREEEPLTAEESKMLAVAISNSKLDVVRPSDGGGHSVPWGPVFFPSHQEFQDPLKYIDSIRETAEKYGICKIVPPEGWNPPLAVDMNSRKKFETKKQIVNRLQEGISFGNGRDYTPAEYQRMAAEATQKWKEEHYADRPMTPGDLEKDYWDIVEGLHDKEFVAEYGNDIDCTAYWSGFELSRKGRAMNGNSEDLHRPLEKPAATAYQPEARSAEYYQPPPAVNLSLAPSSPASSALPSLSSSIPDMPPASASSCSSSSSAESASSSEPRGASAAPPPPPLPYSDPSYYRESWWNLNNIPSCPGSVLRHVKVPLNGVNVPWLYMGTLFSTFCWHNEDNYLYSINYHHTGAPKQWYGVPGSKKDAEGLEKVFKNFLALKMREAPDLLHHITTMFSPRLLQQASVPVYKILQQPGDFIVTFPRAFHSGFSMGPNIGEAVNFATPDWISHGAAANERYRGFGRQAVFSHDRLTFTLATYLDEHNLRSLVILHAELSRVIEEEQRLRARLFDLGVRDVRGTIRLPPNRLDQLDEQSADYDDKRLCHACSHICFFSAVACECSQSKVSCLRHSHFMCKCAPNKRYMLIWSSTKEMANVLQTVDSYIQLLKTRGDFPPRRVKSEESSGVDEVVATSSSSSSSSDKADAPSTSSACSTSAISSSIPLPIALDDVHRAKPKVGRPPKGYVHISHHLAGNSSAPAISPAPVFLPPIGQERDMKRREGEPCCVTHAAGYERYPLEARWQSAKEELEKQKNPPADEKEI